MFRKLPFSITRQLQVDYPKMNNSHRGQTRAIYPWVPAPQEISFSDEFHQFTQARREGTRGPHTCFSINPIDSFHIPRAEFDCLSCFHRLERIDSIWNELSEGLRSSPQCLFSTFMISDLVNVSGPNQKCLNRICQTCTVCIPCIVCIVYYKQYTIA